MPTLTQQKRIAVPTLRNASRSAAAQRTSGGAASGGPVGGKSDATDGGTGKPKRRAARRWMAAALMLATALLTVAFVANAIKVNELLAAITSVEAEQKAVVQQNERLRAELLRLMSVEQVTARAAELGMVQPEVPPVGLPLKGAASESVGKSGTE